MTKENIYREARKLVNVLNTWGNCIVPSIYDDKRDTTALERLDWLMKQAKDEHGLTVDDVETGIAELNI
jgi:hypothetical protein